MPVHDYILSNQSGSSFRSDLNNALAAIVSQNSNATEPATTYAFQYWIDTSATPALVKQRNAANDAWVTLAEVDGQTLAADGTTSKPGISFAADVNCGLRRNAADDISIITGGTQAITIDSTQKVGIGTTSPSTALHLSSSSPKITITDTDTNATHEINADSSGANFAISVDTTEVGDTGAKSSLILNTHGEERLRIQGGTGNVGIGTNNPGTLFNVQGSRNYTGTTPDVGDYDVSIRSGTAEVGIGQHNGIPALQGYGTGTAYNIALCPANGDVLIGTTSADGNGGLSLRPNESNGSAQIRFNRANTTATTYAVVFRNNASTVGSIRYNNSTTSYVTTSDYRVKENVVDVTDGITRVKQLAPKRFNFIANPDTIVDGFLAHEAQTVVPEAVAGTHDEMEDIGTLSEWDGTVLETDIPEPSADELTWQETIADEDGNKTVETRTRTWTQTGSQPVYQGIDQSKLVPLLTAALQEAIAKIETLETKVAALEAAN